MHTSKMPRLHVSQALTEKAFEMQAVMPYRTIKHGEPPIRPEPIKYRASAQAEYYSPLARADMISDRPNASEQTIPSYNGFHAGLNMKQRKSNFICDYY